MSACEDEDPSAHQGLGCEAETGPAGPTTSDYPGSEGWITCHYHDQFGVPQRLTLLSSEPLHHLMARQEEVRFAVEQLCSTLGYEVLSIQLVMVGANHIGVAPGPSLSGQAGAQVLDFPVRQRSSTE
jgi:hypothetical protein